MVKRFVRNLVVNMLIVATLFASIWFVTALSYDHRDVDPNMHKHVQKLEWTNHFKS